MPDADHTSLVDSAVLALTEAELEAITTGRDLLKQPAPPPEDILADFGETRAATSAPARSVRPYANALRPRLCRP
jgi:hypothetical protein